MRAHALWVSGPWRGRLGIELRPRGGDWLIDEMRAWRQSGIDHVMSLLEADEQTELDLQDEARAAADNGLEFTGFPVPDRGVPASAASAATLVRGIITELERVGPLARARGRGSFESVSVSTALRVGAFDVNHVQQAIAKRRADHHHGARARSVIEKDTERIRNTVWASRSERRPVRRSESREVSNSRLSESLTGDTLRHGRSHSPRVAQ